MTRDNLTPEQRSYTMSRIRGKDTGLELLVRHELRRRRLTFHVHRKDLPGCPDVVFSRQRIAVFIDGDFWHGYHFPAWQHTLSSFWSNKILANRRRDQRNFAALRRRGWVVLRLWQHDIKRDLDGVVNRVAKAVSASRSRSST